MPNILSEQIHYSVPNAKDALDKIRLFAVAQGWTQDVWLTSGDYFLQLFSNGYSVQNLCYRFRIGDRDVNSQTMVWNAVRPTYRFSGSTSAFSGETWGGSDIQHCYMDLPNTTFTALYLYGNKNVIIAIWHIDPISVITTMFGTFELFPSWRNRPDLSFYYPSQYYQTSDAGRWYNIVDNDNYWYWPPQSRFSSGNANHIYWDNAPRDSTYYCCNYRPTNSIAIGNETGDFNVPKGLLNWNAFTEKRVAFQSTFFIRDTSLLVWYPLGNSSWSFINGRDLTIGEEIYFGGDTYRCFPILYSTSDIWQAYRTA